MKNQIEIFKIYYKGNPPVESVDQLIYRAKSTKDRKYKMKRAMTYITSLGLMLRVSIGEGNSFIIKPLFS